MSITEQIMAFSHTYSGVLEKILASLVIIFVMLLLDRVFRRATIKFSKGAQWRYQMGKTIGYVSLLLTIFLIATIWLEQLGEFGALIGILGAGFALVLKEPITTFVGWIYLTSNSLYHLGDRIQLGDLKGDVVDIGPMRTTLIEVENWVDGEQNTGRIVHVPNNMLFVHSLHNYTRASGFIWVDVSVTITFESNWKKAMEIMTELISEDGNRYAKEAEEEFVEDQTKYLIKHGKLTPITYLRVAGYGVKLSTRFLSPVRKRRNVESDYYGKILDAFAKEKDIELAYETFRVVK